LLVCCSFNGCVCRAADAARERRAYLAASSHQKLAANY